MVRKTWRICSYQNLSLVDPLIPRLSNSAIPNDYERNYKPLSPLLWPKIVRERRTQVLQVSLQEKPSFHFFLMVFHRRFL